MRRQPVLRQLWSGQQLAGTLLALPLMLSLAVAGCGRSDDTQGVATAGGGGDPAASASASPGNLNDAERQIQFAQCMRENGVDVPDPEPGADGPRFRFGGGDNDPQKIQAAMEKCRHLLPNGGERRALNPEQVEQMRKLATCMRENGVPDFPDPDAEGRLNLDLKNFDRNDPKMKAAFEKCRDLAPEVMGRGR